MNGTYCSIILGVCSFLLTILFWYALWIRVRVIRLKEDLYRLGGYLEAAAAAAWRDDDPAYRATAAEIKAFAGVADRISVATAAYTIWASHQLADPLRPGLVKSDDPLFQKLLDSYRNRLFKRISDYLIFETLGGWVIGLLLWILPQVSRRQIRREAVQSFEPMEMMGVS